MEDTFLDSNTAQWKKFKNHGEASCKSKSDQLLVVWPSSGDLSFHMCKMEIILISY